MYKIVYFQSPATKTSPSELLDLFCISQVNHEVNFDDTKLIYDKTNYPEVRNIDECTKWFDEIFIYAKLPNILQGSTYMGKLQATFTKILWPPLPLSPSASPIPAEKQPPYNIKCSGESRSCKDIQEGNFLINKITDTRESQFTFSTTNFGCNQKTCSHLALQDFLADENEDNIDDNDDDDDDGDDNNSKTPDIIKVGDRIILFSDETISEIQSSGISDKQVKDCTPILRAYLESKCNPYVGSTPVKKEKNRKATQPKSVCSGGTVLLEASPTLSLSGCSEMLDGLTKISGTIRRQCLTDLQHSDYLNKNAEHYKFIASQKKKEQEERLEQEKIAKKERQAQARLAKKEKQAQNKNKVKK